MPQTPLTFAAIATGALFGAGTVRVLPKDLDITIVFTAAGLGAGALGFMWAILGREWQRGALFGARWGALGACCTTCSRWSRADTDRMAVETAKRLFKARSSSATRVIGAAVIVGCFAIVLFKYGVVLTGLFAGGERVSKRRPTPRWRALSQVAIALAKPKVMSLLATDRPDRMTRRERLARSG